MQTGSTYHRPTRFGDEVEVHSRVVAFERRSFRIEHRILCGDELRVEGFELRFLGQPHPDDPQRLRAADLPESFRAAFGFA